MLQSNCNSVSHLYSLFLS